MVEAIVEWVTRVIGALGYPGVVALMTIESACIPLPSEIIMPFSGFLVARATFNLHWASLAGALGCLIGSLIAYTVGYYGGRPLVQRYGKYVLIGEREFATADRWFARRGEWTVFISRLLPVVRTFISLPAGIARMNLGRFALYSFVGSVPWCYLLTYVGFVLGSNWRRISPYMHRLDVVVIAGLVLLLAWGISRRLRAAKAK
jgi:membrane protein DedA with SNARE-associated domain